MVLERRISIMSVIANTSPTVEFKVGQKVVYPNYGVTLVEKIEPTSWDGEEQDCYHLRLLANDAQIMVPVINQELVGLRPLCDKKEIKDLFTYLRSPSQVELPPPESNK